MEERISVRQWQDKFLAGEFDSKDRAVQCAAGWYDWFCKDDALAGRLKKIGRVVVGITDPFILDNYYVWFKNNCPLSGPLYDDVRFEPLTGERDGKYFLVSKDSPHEREKWSLVTERYGYESSEFECANMRDMVKYINGMGRELEQGIQPEFIAEKNAAAQYFVELYDQRHVGSINREGEHCYSCRSPHDRQTVTVLVASHQEDGLPDRTPAKVVDGLSVFPLNDNERQALRQVTPKVTQQKHRQQER